MERMSQQVVHVLCGAHLVIYRVVSIATNSIVMEKATGTHVEAANAHLKAVRHLNQVGPLGIAVIGPMDQ